MSVYRLAQTHSQGVLVCLECDRVERGVVPTDFFAFGLGPLGRFEVVPYRTLL
jgi:hypothetical protein